MDELDAWRATIKERINYYAQFKPAVGDVQIEVIFDEAKDHYELMYAGWNGSHRIHGSVLHIDIRDGKVFIEHDGTEDGIAYELVEAGIPQDKIVLAFKAPKHRKYTEFAVG